MKKVFALLLAGLILMPAMLFDTPGGVAHASAFSRATVPLTNLSPQTSQNSQLLSADNPGHFNQSPITHGFQLTDSGYAGYALDGKYTTLSGTLYGDDNSSNTGTILVVDATQRDPRVLLSSDVPKGARQSFSVTVRGVGSLMIEQSKCCGVYIDVVARLTPGPRVPVPPVTGTELDTVNQETAQGSQSLALDSPGHFNGLLIAHGFQLTDSGYAGYALDGKYTTLSGTLYGDDNSSNTGTILVVDMTQRDPRILLSSDVPKGARKSFKVSVKGVSHLMFEQSKCCGVYIDVVAAMARGKRVHIPPFTGTALEDAPIDTSQGSQLLSLDSPGHFTGALITHGFQLTDNGSATYLPRRHYTTLSGTLYGDDNSSNTGAILIEDASGATPRVLARYDVPKDTRRSFRLSVRGVSRLTLTQSQCCGVYIDIIATLTH